VDKNNRSGERYLVASDLDEINRQADWRALFEALGLVRDDHRSKLDDWWARSPFAEDRTPSFHMNDRGWHCFSTGQGGGPVRLVQLRLGLDCYAAGRWLLEHGLSSCSRLTDTAPAAAPPASGEEETSETPRTAKTPNRPIRQDLLPALDASHPELARRGLSAATCAYLGCGYYGEEHRGPLAGRIVFQVRSVKEKAGRLAPVILTHMGRALTAEQAQAAGKWYAYKGFRKTLELYNQDKLLLDPDAIAQAQATGRILLVEGGFDVARLVEAGILNVVASFGAHLDEDQLPRLRAIAKRTRVRQVRVWYDRDEAGGHGQQQAIERITRSGDLVADGFDWDVTFPSPARGEVGIPAALTDPGELSVEQLRFLRQQGLV